MSLRAHGQQLPEWYLIQVGNLLSQGSHETKDAVL